MKLKKLLFIGFFFLSLSSFSQQKNEYRPISEMNSEEKEMYDILQKSVMAFLNNKPSAKLFPVFKTYEDKKELVFSSLIYDEQNYNTWDEGSSSATYTVSLHFTKQVEVNIDPNGSYGTIDPNFERNTKEPIKYHLWVIYSKSNFDFQDRTLLTLYNDKPFFDAKFN